MLFESLISLVKVQGGFDVDDATAGGWVNEVHKEVVAAAQWMQAEESLGTTVAGQAEYDLAANIVDVVAISIDPGDGSGPGEWKLVGQREIWDLRGSRLWLRGSGGVFAPWFTSAAGKQIALYPAPSQSGLQIMALAALIPPDLTTGSTPVIPEDMHSKLADGAVSLGLLRIEERPDLAQTFEDRKDAMITQLMRRKNSRIGSEPTRIKMQFVDFL